jgi:hypothetical protein
MLGGLLLVLVWEVTYQPSAVLRAGDQEGSGRIRAALIADLRFAAAALVAVSDGDGGGKPLPEPPSASSSIP